MYRDESIRQKYQDVFSPVGQYDEILRSSRLTQYKIFADYNVSCLWEGVYENGV